MSPPRTFERTREATDAESKPPPSNGRMDQAASRAPQRRRPAYTGGAMRPTGGR